MLTPFETTLADLCKRSEAFDSTVTAHVALDEEKQKAITDAVSELREAARLYQADRNKLLGDIGTYVSRHSGESRNPDNNTQHAAREAFDPHAEAIRGLVKQIDLLYKLAARIADLASEVSLAPGNGGEGVGEGVFFDRRATARLLKRLDQERKAAVEQLKRAVYFHRQVAWLQDRFPKAELEAVPGLVKLVDRKEIEAADWSLTPGRYVGVAPPEEDEDFDFEQTLRNIHTELADLNQEAVDLAAKIQENFEELGI